MTDLPPLVYFVRSGDDNEELRYSLRSVARNYPTSEVWIVGYKPRWVTGVRFIRGNRFTSKPINVYDNVRIISTHPEIPDEFLMMNDDFYFLKPVTAPVEHRYRSTLDEHIATLDANNKWWRQSMIITRRWLIHQGLTDLLSYDMHRPFPTVKAQMDEVTEKASLFYRDNPPQWRTIYGNYWHIECPKVERDCKVQKRSNYEKLLDFDFISTTDMAWRMNGVGDWLQMLFPEPCAFEKASSLSRPAPR